MSAQRSPAPWKFRGSYLRDADGNELASAVPFRGPISQDLANRALIAAAPEMLDLIRRMAAITQDAESIPFPLKVRFRLVCMDATEMLERLEGSP